MKQKTIKKIKHFLLSQHSLLIWEYNDEVLRKKFVLVMDKFLNRLIQNNSIKDYKVICDEKINDSQTIVNGEFKADVYIMFNDETKKLEYRIGRNSSIEEK